MCWFNKSSDLRAAAAAVWTSMDCDLGELIVKDCRLGGGFNMGVAVSPVFHMLCGMAMELIFKALTVEHGCKVNESSHDLLSHLAGTGLSYSDNERELLKILSHDITWAGRYPTPKKKEHLEAYQNLVRENLFGHEPLGSGSLCLSSPNGALDWDAFNKMWSKAMSEYFRIKT